MLSLPGLAKNTAKATNTRPKIVKNKSKTNGGAVSNIAFRLPPGVGWSSCHSHIRRPETAEGLPWRELPREKMDRDWRNFLRHNDLRSNQNRSHIYINNCL